MKRRPLNLLTALSLLFCVAVLYLLGFTWIRGEYKGYIGGSAYMFAADRFGVGIIRFSSSRPRGVHIRVPYVIAVPALALLPAVAGLRWRREALSRRRIRSGLCPACDYDLTGNVSGTCPECGTEVR